VSATAARARAAAAGPPASASGPEAAFAEAVRELVAQIPAGRAMSYGAVAACLGSRAARRVGRVMHDSGGTGLPWWRVVTVKGTLPLALWAQALPRYLAEQTPLVLLDNSPIRVDMSAAAWDPLRGD